MKEGNQCLYQIKQVFNALLMLSGGLLIGIGVYLWLETEQFSFIELAFFILGGAQVLLSFLVLGSKKSVYRSKLYNIILGILVTLQLSASIIGLVLREKLIEKAIEQQKGSEESINQLKELLEKNITVALYLTLICFGIQICCLFFSILYFSSLKSRNETYNLLYDDKDRKYQTYDEIKNQQQNITKQNANQRREELCSNNPDFYEWKQKQEKKNKKIP